MRKQLSKIIICFAIFVNCVFNGMTANATGMNSADSAIINIESYEVEEDVLMPGEQITIHLFLKNNSEATDVKNLLLTMDSSGYTLWPVYGEDNQVFVGDIEAGNTKEVVVKATVNSAFNAPAAQLTCHFSYISGVVALNNSSSIFIPTYPGGDLIPVSAVVSGNTSLGARTLVSVQYKNVGAEDMTDIVLKIEGNIDEVNKEIKLPVVKAGKTYTNDYYIVFKENGVQNVNLKYEYKDNNGETKEIECGTYQVNVTGTTSTGSAAVVTGQDETNSTLKVGVLLGVFVASLGLTIFYIRKRK